MAYKMMMKLFINASLATSSNALKRVNVLFDDKIQKISPDEIIPEEEVEIIDLKGKLLLPGGVDPHLHFFGKKADLPKKIQSISQKALAGGWTAIAEMSYHSQQPIFNPRALGKMIEIIEANSFNDIALWGHVDISEYPYHAESAQELWNKGVVGIALMLALAPATAQKSKGAKFNPLAPHANIPVMVDAPCVLIVRTAVSYVDSTAVAEVTVLLGNYAEARHVAVAQVKETSHSEFFENYLEAREKEALADRSEASQNAPGRSLFERWFGKH